MLQQLLKGKHDAPVVTAMTITREEFRRTPPLAQSFAGQATHYGVTLDGRSLDHRSYVAHGETETGTRCHCCPRRN